VDTRTTFTAAANAFSDLVERLPSGVWAQPGLGDWDVRALTGHASRSLITVSTYLRRPVQSEDIASPEGYYTAIASMLRGAAADPAAVTERGRVAGEALGDDPAAVVRTLVADALRDVDRPDDPLMETIAGGMRLSEYLPTRTFELAVHSLDIAAATGVEVTLPDDVLSEAVALAGRVVVLRGDGADVLLALTGRRPLPAGFSIV
jgi:uncharacterized protein (TIGR03083 family)